MGTHEDQSSLVTFLDFLTGIPAGFQGIPPSNVLCCTRSGAQTSIRHISERVTSTPSPSLLLHVGPFLPSFASVSNGRRRRVMSSQRLKVTSPRGPSVGVQANDINRTPDDSIPQPHKYVLQPKNWTTIILYVTQVTTLGYALPPRRPWHTAWPSLSPKIAV